MFTNNLNAIHPFLIRNILFKIWVEWVHFSIKENISSCCYRLLVYKNLCHNDICTLMFCVLYLSLLIINISFLMRAFSFLCYRKTADFLNEAFGVNEDDIYRVFAVAFTNDFSHSCSHSGQVKWRLRWPRDQVTRYRAKHVD